MLKFAVGTWVEGIYGPKEDLEMRKVNGILSHAIIHDGKPRFASIRRRRWWVNLSRIPFLRYSSLWTEKMLFPDSLFTLGIGSDRLLLLHVDPSFFQFPKFFPSKPANFCLNPHCFILFCSTILSANCYFLYFWTSSRVSASLVCHVLSQIVFFLFSQLFPSRHSFCNSMRSISLHDFFHVHRIPIGYSFFTTG